MVWVNVDKPTKRYVVHASKTCTYVRNRRDTGLKGVGVLKRDGGWLLFSNVEKAQTTHRNEFPEFQLHIHC